MPPKLATSAGPRWPHNPTPLPPLKLVALTPGELHALARIVSAEAAEARADGDIAEANHLERRAAALTDAAR
jgi:hypothetical protein